MLSSLFVLYNFYSTDLTWNLFTQWFWTCFMFTGCFVHDLQQLWSSPENRYFPEKRCPSNGGISFNEFDKCCHHCLSSFLMITTDNSVHVCHSWGKLKRHVLFILTGLAHIFLTVGIKMISIAHHIFYLTLLITFDSVQSAQRAKASLNGADIYSGCCTLKIEYAKVQM